MYNIQENYLQMLQKYDSDMTIALRLLTYKKKQIKYIDIKEVFHESN